MEDLLELRLTSTVKKHKDDFDIVKSDSKLLTFLNEEKISDKDDLVIR
jgi:hypothetical protein